MSIDVSLGRWSGQKTWKPTIVKIAPGWWRFECHALSVEVDDEVGFWPTIVTWLGGVGLFGALIGGPL